MALRLWLGHPQPHRGPSLDSQARAFAQEKVPDAWRAALGLPVFCLHLPCKDVYHVARGPRVPGSGSQSLLRHREPLGEQGPL